MLPGSGTASRNQQCFKFGKKPKPTESVSKGRSVGRSCWHILQHNKGSPDGEYQLTDGRIVWCDMQTDGNPPLYDAAGLHDRDSKYSKGFIDGGGWMLAVHIKGSDQHHRNTGAVGDIIIRPNDEDLLGEKIEGKDNKREKCILSTNDKNECEPTTVTSKYDDNYINQHMGKNAGQAC